jgi:phospholipid-binding lipoprotein MlaA
MKSTLKTCCSLFLLLLLLGALNPGKAAAGESEASAVQGQTRDLQLLAAQEDQQVSDELFEELSDDFAVQEKQAVPDPLEPVNRFFFQVNDKLYFYLLKPVAQGYKAVLPEPFRNGIGNAFTNIGYPGRFVNNVLQARLGRALQETGIFVVNTLFGFGGLLEPAKGIEALDPAPPEKDTGLTFGTWGLDHGCYLVLPVFGPSSIRDGVGRVGDYFLDPLNYVEPSLLSTGLKAGERVNDLSFRIGDYEDIKQGAMDPYTAVKDGYFQYRDAQLEK